MSPTLPFCLSFFSICCDFRKSNKNNFREKVFILAHSSRVCSVIKRKPRQQGVKAAGYITSTVKNKAMNAYSAGFLVYIQTWTSAQGMIPLTMGW